MNTNTVIGLKILALIAAGANPMDALKLACGEANVNQMIDDLYHQLRAKA